MNDINKLVNKYIKFIQEKFYITDIDKNEYSITTPFLDRHNDLLEIYVKLSPNEDNIILTDYGETITDLAMSGLEINTPTRIKQLDRILNGFGVIYKSETKELMMIANSRSFAKKQHNLIQAMLAVNDLFVLASHSVKSLFNEDVALFLENNNIRATENVAIEGRSGWEHKINFVIPGFKDIPERLINISNKPSKTNLKPILFNFNDISTKRNSQNYIMLNDTDKKIKAEIINAIKELNVTPIIWSERNKYLDSLVA